MHLPYVLFILQLRIVPSLNDARVKRSSCGILRGCWSVPTGCTGNECTAKLQWSVSGRESILRIRLEALLRDLPCCTIYVALGFSEDQHMGDDTVLECAYNDVDGGRAYLSYNDGKYNTRLYEATVPLIVKSSFVVNDDTFACLLDVDFKQYYRLSDEDKSKAHNLLVSPYYLQLVRGSIDPHTYVKKMHSLSDGPLHPWVTTTAVSMLRDKDGKYVNVENAHQAKWFPRNITYAMTILHVILIIWSWWFLISNAILLSRYFQGFWPATQISHKPVWFQLHRGGILISMMLQTVAILLIVVQAKFQFYLWCTRQCTTEHLMKPVHTWSGLIAYIVAVVQTSIALHQYKWRRIGPFYFRWFHRILAVIAFVAACEKTVKLTKLLVALGILSATAQEKTGLLRYHGRWPLFLLGFYLCTFSAVLLLLSFLDAYSKRRLTERNEHIEKENEENPRIPTKFEVVEAADEGMKHEFCRVEMIRLSVLILHVVISFTVCFIVTAMVLINYTRKH